VCEHARKEKREIEKENTRSFSLNEVDSERYFLCINIAREFQDGNDTWREDTRSVIELSVIDQCADVQIHLSLHSRRWCSRMQ